ncbi:MAG: T9SS type A sorting domain-containing protein [Crocinitomicaceae bacterium]|nr:T9SS type A sorting domain-containing protein [Crocinitomicaceae bacterium]
MKLLMTLALVLGSTFTFSQLTLTIDYQMNPWCFGEPTGEFQISVTGGTAPYTFSVNPTGMNQSSVDADTEYFFGFMAGMYTVTVQDATMATNTIDVFLNDPPIFAGTATVTDDTCSASIGSISINGLTGGVPPFTYSLNGGAQSPTNVFNGLPAGAYTVEAIDANGCYAWMNPQTVIVNNSLLAGGSAQGIATSYPAYCNNGGISLQVTAGLAPFEVVWNTGDTLFLLNNLGAGTYTANVTDANGCAVQFQAVVADSSAAGGCSEISGRVYSDLNNNCTDQAEPGMNSVALKATPGNYTVLANSNGDYQFNLPYGSYMIEQAPALNLVNNCTPSYNVLTNAGNPSSTGNDFADSLYMDYGSIFAPGWIRPMMANYQTLYTKNYSSASGIVDIYYLPDNNYIVDSILPGYDYMNGDTMFWSNVNLGAFGLDLIRVFGHTNMGIGTPLVFCHGVLPQGYDHVASNNANCHTSVVIGSFDPNDKQVWPSGDIYLTDEELTYKIRFQNTGTDTAFNIFIMDTLSDYLDASTFQFLASSHYCIPEIIDNNILKFTFPNIMLPDSNTNEALSHGHVIFRIKQNQNNQVGNVIENTAGIYFDYNEPVITNTTSSPIVQDVTGINELKLEDLSVYPNPANGEFKVVFPSNAEGLLMFFDAQGRLVLDQQIKGQKQTQINASNWEKGVYLIQFRTNSGVSTGKIVIE